ncbi:MAG: alpha/beta hydrolase, partial [Acidimicrobiia bacterium]|nr:alpha/beta hydrolase [Acidimicrobiia bacterium]
MPIVFVHGVPDTVALWDPLVAALVARGVAESDTVRLALPGFAAPVPDGFDCIKDEYATWIVGQLEAIGTPVDLVGHDWGALLTQYVGSGNPSLIRSWAAFDGAVDRDDVWHDLAQAWQTPEVGEQVMEAMSGDALVDGLRDGGHPDAEGAARFVDDAMKAAVLALYRSAITVGDEWQPTVERNERPALVGWGEHDPYAAVEMGRAVATRAHGDFVLLEGAGHWSVFERPDETAAALV